MPSFHSRDLTSLAIRSFIQYSNGFNFNFYVVENSTDTSYRDEILSLSSQITWIQNPTKHRNSEANAVAIAAALERVKSDYVFICHNDVVACHDDWLKFLFDKVDKQGYSVCGFVKDNQRMSAIHISGLLTKTKIAKDVSMFPVYDSYTGKQIADVGDLLTGHCRNNDLKYFCCRNTHNDEDLQGICKAPFDGLYFVDRALNDQDEVIFLHLGRGTPKTFGSYHKANRLNLRGWADFVEDNILNVEKKQI